MNRPVKSQSQWVSSGVSRRRFLGSSVAAAGAVALGAPAILRGANLNDKLNIAIIGAGFGGMAAAYDLKKAGHQATIFEAADYVGGLASGFKEPGWDWSVEKFYHHWFASDKHMLGLIRELGLEDKVLFPRPLTVMYHKGKFYPFDSIIKMALFPGLGWGINKIRFGLVGLYLRLTNNWKSLEKSTVDEWLRKWAGKKVYELMWQPLVMGKFGERYYKQVNMAWMWARLKTRTTRLGTFQGGFQTFADRFAGRLGEMGVSIQMGTAINRISPHPQGGLVLDITGPQGDTSTQRFDQVLSTTSPALMARLERQDAQHRVDVSGDLPRAARPRRIPFSTISM